jgi:hypothetical protein
MKMNYSKDFYDIMKIQNVILILSINLSSATVRSEGKKKHIEEALRSNEITGKGEAYFKFNCD